MSRSPEEILRSHVAAVTHGDIPGILKDYSNDAVLLTPQGALDGHAGIEGFYRMVLETLPGVELTATSIVAAGDAMLVNYTATSPAGNVSDGVDSFVFADGAIRVQTASFTVVPTSGS